MAKTEKKAKPKAKAKKAAPKRAAAAAGKGAAVATAPAVRQPGVERRRNHPTRAKDGYMQVLLTHAVAQGKQE